MGLGLGLAALLASCDTGRAIVDEGCEPACTDQQVCIRGVCVGTGALRVTLTWDEPGDLDLHVVTPSGQEVFWGTPLADGAMLDRDDVRGNGPENVYWHRAPSSGEYLVCVNPYAIERPTVFTVRVAVPDREDRVWHGQREHSNGTVRCSREAPGFVGSFSFP
jgi:hypothetical protein